MDDLPAPLCIFRCDPTLNRARFYEIALRPSLFAEVTLVLRWGRIGTQGQTRLQTFPDLVTAVAAAQAMAQAKRRRGYAVLVPKLERDRTPA